MDLIPPPQNKGYKFDHKLEAPPPNVNQADMYRVSATRLAVPDRARRELLRAEEAQLRGDKQEVVQHLERAVEIFPNYTDALNNLGTYYHRKGEYSRSAGYFSKAARLEPGFFPAWVNLGGSLLASGDLDSALAANRKAVELRPNDPLANSQMGINYFYLRNYSEAKKYLLNVLSLDPSSANSPQLFLAHIAFAERQPADAEHYIRSYLELHPNSPQSPHLQRTLLNIASGGFMTPQESPNPKR
jgi:tetratricopeptide (TPR) repeat protein